jgi:hypothetical protein
LLQHATLVLPKIDHPVFEEESDDEEHEVYVPNISVPVPKTGTRSTTKSSWLPGTAPRDTDAEPNPGKTLSDSEQSNNPNIQCSPSSGTHSEGFSEGSGILLDGSLRAELLGRPGEIVVNTSLDEKPFEFVELKEFCLPSAIHNQAAYMGEKLVFEYLKAKFPDSEVKWANENSETYLPYDIILADSFIEVKSTIFKCEEPKSIAFHISVQELEFALQKRDKKYSVYRVFDVQGTSPVVVPLEDLLSLLVQKQVSMCVVNASFGAA